MSMSGGLVGLAGRLERRPGLLGAAKLANVVLAMAWGFVVTFVFVRLLPLSEFRAFLLLVAFANFTVSAALGACLIALGIAAGLISTSHPGLFIAFYGVSALNLLAVLAKRVLAALDHNLWWEGVDFVRRILGVALLVASLVGLPILDSVLLQLAISLALLWLGMATIHRSLAMAPAQWLAAGQGGAHVRAHYLADFGRTGALTLFDVAAYNAPYFTITAATHDPRPLLLFDFVFKVSRALSAVIRAIIETMLPRLTRAWFGGAMADFRTGLRRCLALSMGVALLAALGLLLVGSPLARLIFDGNLALDMAEIAAMAILLLGLALICVSVYVQNGLGRFGALVPPSFAFLLGSLLSVPAAVALGGGLSLAFVSLYAFVHLALGLVHGRMLARLGEERPA